MNARRAWFLSIAILGLAGCGGTNTADDAGASDAGASDAAMSDAGASDGGGTIDAATDDAGASDAGGGTDAGPSACGTAQPTLPTAGTEGLVIARDGTIYYSVDGGVARIRPDGTNEPSWLPIPGASTIWGLALDASNTHLFVGDPGAGVLHAVSGIDSAPRITALATISQPNGVTVGPDGAVYVSDFASGDVLRVDPAGGPVVTVTATPISGADGVAFTDDGHLLVTSYAAGTVLSLALDATHHETGRTTVARNVPSADGVAIDTAGTIYVGGGSRVYRIGAGGTPDMTLQMGHPGTANLEWGAGPLDCHDLYVATGSGLTRISLAVGQRAVPWH